MRALTQSSKHERSGHSRSLSFPSVSVFRLTSVIPERIIFVSRGISVLARDEVLRCAVLNKVGGEMYAARTNRKTCISVKIPLCTHMFCIRLQTNRHHENALVHIRIYSYVISGIACDHTSELWEAVNKDTIPDIVLGTDEAREESYGLRSETHILWTWNRSAIHFTRAFIPVCT